MIKGNVLLILCNAAELIGHSDKVCVYTSEGNWSTFVQLRIQGN